MQDQTWTFTSKRDGSSSQGLSSDEAVKVLYRAMHGFSAPAQTGRAQQAPAVEFPQALDLRSAA